MLNKISGLARSLYILLAIVAAFVALGGMNVALILVVLGLIAGLSMEKENYVPAAATAIALPIIGAALGQIPSIGAQLTAICANLQIAIAGALATALAYTLYQLMMHGVMGLAGGSSGSTKAATAG
ncbi:MAG TPA: hypothetical protein VFK50_04195 [Sphingomicrobium sp.]|nr:hypothetical protein [Sphingomicrobium sp.]